MVDKPKPLIKRNLGVLKASVHENTMLMMEVVDFTVRYRDWNVRKGDYGCQPN